jgi:hypothetical protein
VKSEEFIGKIAGGASLAKPGTGSALKKKTQTQAKKPRDGFRNENP